MDSDRFDALAKALATRPSRRRLISGLAGGFAAALGLTQSVNAQCSRPTPIRCGEACVDLRTDPSNCGRCGNECLSGLCYAGRCLESCPSGFEPCGGTCIRTCANGQVCLGGTCQDPPPAGSCAPGDDECVAPGSTSCGTGCWCGTTIDGAPICRDLVHCLLVCASHADCPLGWFCVNCPNVCNGDVNACAPPCF